VLKAFIGSYQLAFVMLLTTLSTVKFYISLQYKIDVSDLQNFMSFW